MPARYSDAKPATWCIARAGRLVCSFVGVARSSGGFGSSMFSEAVTAELDAMGVVNDAIEDGIGQRWIAARSPLTAQSR
jgi:hypothetical protein